MGTIPKYFGAYYEVPNKTEINEPILYGLKRFHFSWCGENICYIRLAVDEILDPSGGFICDSTLWDVDDQENIKNFLATGDISFFHPITKAIISGDFEDGLSLEEILEKRAGIMMGPFLGFVANHIHMVKPELAQPTIHVVDGNEFAVYPVSVCSWEQIDNPEFL